MARVRRAAITHPRGAADGVDRSGRVRLGGVADFTYGTRVTAGARTAWQQREREKHSATLSIALHRQLTWHSQSQHCTEGTHDVDRWLQARLTAFREALVREFLVRARLAELPARLLYGPIRHPGDVGAVH